jgi:hypothetical protein
MPRNLTATLQMVQILIMMAFVYTLPIPFDKEVCNINLCMHQLESSGHLIAFAGGVDGQMGKM